MPADKIPFLGLPIPEDIVAASVQGNHLADDTLPLCLPKQKPR